jgi:hypothetical protein
VDRLNCEQQFKSRAARAVANALFFPSHTHTHALTHNTSERARGARTLLYIAGLYAYNVTRPPTHPPTHPTALFRFIWCRERKILFNSDQPLPAGNGGGGGGAQSQGEGDAADAPRRAGGHDCFFWRHARQSATRCAR